MTIQDMGKPQRVHVGTGERYDERCRSRDAVETTDWRVKKSVEGAACA